MLRDDVLNSIPLQMSVPLNLVRLDLLRFGKEPYTLL